MTPLHLQRICPVISNPASDLVDALRGDVRIQLSMAVLLRFTSTPSDTICDRVKEAGRDFYTRPIRTASQLVILDHQTAVARRDPCRKGSTVLGLDINSKSVHIVTPSS